MNIILHTATFDTYKIHCAEAAMTNLTEVSEELLRVLLKEQLCYLGVLHVPCPAGGGHAASWRTRRARRGLSGRANATHKAPQKLQKILTCFPEDKLS